MQSSDQCGEFLLLYILELINKHSEGRTSALRRHARSFKQRLQVVLKIAVVGQSGLWLKIEPHFDVMVFHFERFGEAGQPA